MEPDIDCQWNHRYPYDLEDERKCEPLWMGLKYSVYHNICYGDDERGNHNQLDGKPD